MGIPQQQFPQEVIDTIINQLHGDAAALKQCALATTAFARTSQQLLFHTVHLDEFYVAHTQTQRLYQTLIESPHLGTFIRELHVLDSPSTASGGNGVEFEVINWVVHEAKFIALFSLLPNLQYLGLTSFYTLDWSRLPEASQNVFSDALGSIPKLKLSNIRNLPVARFKNFHALKSLILDQVHFDSDPDKQILAVPALHQGYLDFIRFSDDSYGGIQLLVEQLLLPTSSLAITQLRRLWITGSLPEVFATASTMMRASSCALEDLTWNLNALDPAFFGKDVQYPALGP